MAPIAGGRHKNWGKIEKVLQEGFLLGVKFSFDLKSRIVSSITVILIGFVLLTI
jgi:hypothetical protein